MEGKASRKEDEAVEHKPLRRKPKRGRKVNNKGKGKALREEVENPNAVPLQDFSNFPILDFAEFLKTQKMKKPREEKRISHTRKTRSKARARTCFTNSSDDEDAMFDFHFRFHRAHDASLFTVDYEFLEGRKICISKEIQYVTPTGKYCFDSSWAAVHGSYTICMVTRRKAVDMTRLSSYYRQCRNEKEALYDFPEAVISEVECIPYTNYGYNHEILRKECGSKVVKPVGVVSLVRTTEKNWEEAIDPVSKFLEQKMKDSSLAFTDYETVQTAIGAYQHMCHGQALRAEDIRVTILDVPSTRFNYLDINVITEQLEIVNGCLSCSKSPETPLTLRRTIV